MRFKSKIKEKPLATSPTYHVHSSMGHNKNETKNHKDIPKKESIKRMRSLKDIIYLKHLKGNPIDLNDKGKPSFGCS